MQVLAQNSPALLTVCENCNALLAYQINDVYEGHFIYCPVCRYKNEVRLRLDYDGEIRNGESKK